MDLYLTLQLGLDSTQVASNNNNFSLGLDLTQVASNSSNNSLGLDLTQVASDNNSNNSNNSSNSDRRNRSSDFNLGPDQTRVARICHLLRRRHTRGWQIQLQQPATR